MEFVNKNMNTHEPNIEKKQTSVPALEKAVRILDLLTSKNQAISGVEISRELNLAKSSVHALTTAMTNAGLIRKTADGHYMLGAHLMYWANGFLAQQDVISAFHESAQEVPELAPHTLTLSTLSQDKVIYLACKNSSAPLGFTFRIGMQLPAVFTATGKIMLSHLSDTEILQRIKTFPAPYTQNSVKSHQELSAEIKEIRAQGFAVDNGQLRLGMYCFSTAILDYTGAANYGLAVSLIEQETDEASIEKLITALKKLANLISQKLGIEKY